MPLHHGAYDRRQDRAAPIGDAFDGIELQGSPAPLSQRSVRATATSDRRGIRQPSK